MMYRHPPVERVVEKEIAQQGRNNRPLRGPFLPGFQCAVFELDEGLKPPLSVQQHPWTVGVLSYRYRVKTGADVQIERPGVSPATLSRNSHRLQCRFSWSITI